MKYSMLNDRSFDPEPLELIDLSTYEQVEQSVLEKAIKHNRELIDDVKKTFHCSTTR